MITIDHDGSFGAIIVFDKKSYVLFEQGSDTPKIKGSSLRSRKTQLFAREYMKEVIMAIYHEQDIRYIFDNYLFLVENRMLSAEQVGIRSNLNKTLEEYKNGVAAGNNPIPTYEIALRSDRRLDKGDVVVYYTKQPPMETVVKRGKEVTRPKKLPAYEKVEPITNYDYDYDVDYYRDVLFKTTRKFLLALGKEEFARLFPEVKLYKKDLDKFNTAYGIDESIGEVDSDEE